MALSLSSPGLPGCVHPPTFQDVTCRRLVGCSLFVVMVGSPAVCERCVRGCLSGRTGQSCCSTLLHLLAVGPPRGGAPLGLVGDCSVFVGVCGTVCLVGLRLPLWVLASQDAAPSKAVFGCRWYVARFASVYNLLLLEVVVLGLSEFVNALREFADSVSRRSVLMYFSAISAIVMCFAGLLTLRRCGRKGVVPHSAEAWRGLMVKFALVDVLQR